MKPLAAVLLLPALALPPAARGADTPGPGANPAAGAVETTLSSGLRVLVRPRHTAPVVTTMMWYRVGSRDELPGATGLAHFLEHLMFKGTKKLAKGAIDRITYRNGGSNNAFTFNDYTAYEFNFPRDHWKVALSIEADRMRNCAFDKKEFEAERQVVMEERRSGQDDPEQNFSEQLNVMAFLAHPYRNPVIGWMEDIRRVSRDEVYAFYRKYYVPANATLVITGDVSPAEALAAARGAFASVPHFPAPARRPVIEPPQVSARRMRMTLPTQVPRVQIDFPVPARTDPDVYPLRLLEYAAAEGKLSRLYQRLVEGDRTAADVSTDLGIYRDLGVFTITASLKPDVHPEQAEEAIWQELERLGKRPLDEKELERAKNQFYAGWVHSIDTANELATVLGEADALGGYSYLLTFLSKVRAVTAADVQRVAARYLRREHSTVGYLLPQTATALKTEDWRLKIADWGGGGGAKPTGSAIANSRLQIATNRSGGAKRAARGAAARTPVTLAAQNPTPRRPNALTLQRPDAPPPSRFQPLAPIVKVLDNGMRLILLENHDLPSVTLSARVDAGSFQETDAQAGLANLTARMLDEGTETRNHREISEALEQVGADLDATAGRANTYVRLTTLAPHLYRLLPLYADILRSPAFPGDRLSLERERVLVDIKEAEDDAPTVARNAFNELVYGRHPAHRPVIGTEKTVRALSPGELEAFHQRWYRPGGTTLVAVGDFRPADLLAALDEAFRGWEAGPSADARSLPEVTRQQDRRERRLTMDKTQTQIVLGHLGIRRTDPDYIPLRVMDTILGEGVSGGFTARIPYQLRDVQGLAYGVGSSITSTAGKEPGTFVAALGTEPGKEARAAPALLKEVRRIRSAPVTDSELREAEEYLANSYVFSFQTNAQLADYLQLVQYYGLGYNYRRQFPRLVRKVTRADVLRVARKHLDPEHYSQVIVGPAAR